MKNSNLLAFVLGMITIGGISVFALSNSNHYRNSDGTPNFQALKSTANNNKLNAEMRDALMDGLSRLQQQQSNNAPARDTSSNSIPAGAIMAFNLSACPAGWTRFADADGRFILGNSTNSREKGGNGSIKLTINQLPSHYFYTTHGSKGNSWLNENPERTAAGMGDRRAYLGHSSRKDTYYYLLGAAEGSVANAGRTNTIGQNQPINITNPYIKLLYCQKN